MPIEIIVVEDCSTDPRNILEKEVGVLISKIVYCKANGRKGVASKSGLKAVTGDVVIIQDADLEYGPNEYLVIVTSMFEGRADAVYRSGFLNRKMTCYKVFRNYALNRFGRKTVWF